MKIVLQNENRDDLEVVIKGDTGSEEVKSLIELLGSVNLKKVSKMIIGKKDERDYVLSVKDIESFYTVNSSLYANHQADEFRIIGTLSEMENLYEKYGFRRVSKSFLINCNYIKYLEVEFSGNYIATTKSEDKLVVSRKYISKVKQYIKEEM